MSDNVVKRRRSLRATHEAQVDVEMQLRFVIAFVQSLGERLGEPPVSSRVIESLTQLRAEIDAVLTKVGEEPK